MRMDSTVIENRTGVILAAGFGSRLKDTVKKSSLKPLTPVAGTPLIFRAIKSLKKAGCTKVVVVLGYGYQKIRSAILEAFADDLEVFTTYNCDFESRNGVSVLAAAKFLEGDFILTMADHVLDSNIMEKAGSHIPPDNGATLLVDYKIDSIFDIQDATKVLSEENKLISIGKELKEYNCIDTGVFVATDGLVEVLEDLYRKKGDVSLSEGIQELADRGRMTTLDIGKAFWQDVDTPEMLEHAENKLKERLTSE